MNVKLLILGLFIGTNSFGQKVSFYADEDLQTKVFENKANYKEVEFNSEDTLIVQVIRISNNLLIQESKWKAGSPVGLWRVFDSKGRKLSERDFRKLVYKKTIEPGIYQNDEKSCSTCEKASFVNGEEALFQFLANKLRYPRESRENGKTGTVYITLIIEKDGTAVPFSIFKGVDPYIDQEVWRILEEMPKWKPAMKNGEAIMSSFLLPVKFTLR